MLIYMDGNPVQVSEAQARNDSAQTIAYTVNTFFAMLKVNDALRRIARKISGGTRSAKGSRTRQVLSSLFGTWAARGDETLQACHTMLAKPLLSQQP